WFTQLMQKAQLASYSAVSGCVVYRPTAYAIWEKIQEITDKKFKKIGIKNAYFPLLIPERLLTKEEEHVEGFAPEVAWVTHSGNTKLNERLAIRPTSEAIMYDSYSQWIRSWRDLPLLINQWNNVIRWEFNNPVPFFRAREFLWNEAHTVFSNEKDAIEHGEKVMEIYNDVTENYMAIPGIYGQKSQKEKFAGAVFTRKVHSYLANGKVIEGTCFHYDGQNFAKAYDIKFKNDKGEEEYAYQNTHALSIRMLGAMLAMHSDNKGLVIPPKMAPNKVVIIPLIFKDSKEFVIEKSKEIFENLERLGKYDSIFDDRDFLSNGRKFSEWELKGIPIRLEIGPKDLENNEVTLAIRTKDEKIKVKIKDIEKIIDKELEQMQKQLYDNALNLLKNNMEKTDNKEELLKLIENKKMVKVPMCDCKECEEILKAETKGGKTLFIDHENESAKNKKCIFCNKDAKYWIYVGKTY
ncbi:MAG: proline--tRNA ligase, partial [Candidatus Nanoarchaeia archaeon]|nr:proline--tRNA ligase [Candidatus Nanoarchaeia archaeon]